MTTAAVAWRTQGVRVFAWVSLCLAFAYVFNNFLIHFAGTGTLFSGHLLAIAIYVLALPRIGRLLARGPKRGATRVGGTHCGAA